MDDQRPGELRFNLFVQNTPSHLEFGQWRRPTARETEFAELDFWIEVVEELERAVIDGLFFGDVTGLFGPAGSDDLGGVMRSGVNFPASDPLILCSALLSRTSHLGLVITSSILQVHPFDFARKMSTFDQLSKGRIGWNVVTSAQENSARNFGLERLVEHDARYEWAEEYLEVLYKLWEGSWDQGAYRADKASGLMVDPGRVRKINHRGERYFVEGPHLPAPSPQRTPLLFQAGSSARGRAFAAKHGEAQFFLAPNAATAQQDIQEIRRLAGEFGRRPDDIKFFQGLSFVIGSTEAEVREREVEFFERQDLAAYALQANFWQDDGSPWDPTTPLSEMTTNTTQGRLDRWRRVLDDKATFADLLRGEARGRTVSGTPEQIVDLLVQWQTAGIDGINILGHWNLPDTMYDFTRQVIPLLQERGLAPREYTPGTLRDRLFGTDLLNGRHPAAAYRSPTFLG